MEMTTIFILYLVLFRLAMISAGIISIVLGYKLFCRGIWPDSGDGSGTAVDARVANMHFTLKNAAPGTCFAMFGVIIIAAMFITGGPELTLKTLQNAGQSLSSSSEGAVASTPESMELTLRGGEDEGLQSLTQKGLYFEGEKDTTRAISHYADALALVAAPANNLAWLYLEKSRLKEALPISRLAVQMAPGNANYLDTLGEILYRSQEYREAVQIMERASQLDTRYLNKLNNYRQAISD